MEEVSSQESKKTKLPIKNVSQEQENRYIPREILCKNINEYLDLEIKENELVEVFDIAPAHEKLKEFSDRDTTNELQDTATKILTKIPKPKQTAETNNLEGFIYANKIDIEIELNRINKIAKEKETVKNYLLESVNMGKILTPTQLIENELIYPEPKNKEEHKKNILAKLTKLHEFRMLEQDIVKKTNKTTSKVNSFVGEFLVDSSPAAIEIPQELKMWEVLELLKSPEIFENSYLKEIGGHYEEDEDKIWVTIGTGGDDGFFCSQGMRHHNFDGNTIFPPERISTNPEERKVLEKPIFFHTHPKGVRSLPTSDEVAPKYYDINKLNLKKPFIERNVLISEKEGKTVYHFWNNIYSPEENKIHFSMNSNYKLKHLREDITEMTDEYWEDQINIENCIRRAKEKAES